MAKANVEAVRRSYDHWNRTGELDWSILDPDVVFDVSRRVFDRGVHQGHEGAGEFLALIREQWSTMRIEPRDLVEAGENVVASVRLVGVGRESGVETTANAAHLWTFREGKAVRLTVFQTTSDALEAVGLSE